MSTTKQIIVINASSLKVSQCKRRFKLIVLDGYSKKLNANDVEFGSGFHACAKDFALNSNIMSAKLAAMRYFQSAKMYVKEKKQYMNGAFLQQCCDGWFPKAMEDPWVAVEGVDGKPLVEYTFYHPFWSTSKTEVIFRGTIDKIVAHSQLPMLAIGDYKTTSMWNIDDYFTSYELSCQLSFYGRAALKIVEASKEGDPLFKFKGRELYSFIDGIFLKGVDKPIEYRRSPLMRITSKSIETFERMLEDEVGALVDRVEGGKEHLPTGILNGGCETKYGRCDFFSYCVAGDERTRGMILDREFTKNEKGIAEVKET